MAWEKILISEKGELSGEQFPFGDFTGLIPFVNQNTDYDWFPQVEINDEKKLEQFTGYEITNMATFFGGIGTGETLIAAFRVSPVDSLHPLAGNFICLLVNTRDFIVTEQGTSVYIAIKVVRRIYDNDGVFTQSYPVGNYFPDKEYILRRENSPDYAVGNKCKFIFGTSYYDLQKNFVVGIVWRRNNGNCQCWSYMAVRFKESYFKSSSGWGTDAEEPAGKVTSPNFGPASQPEGGYNESAPHGTFDDSSDVIGIDAKPNVGVTTMGFVNVYKITQGQLQALGEKLFPHFLPAEILADPSQLTTPETLVMLLKALYGTMVLPVGSTIELADNLGIIDILMNGKLIDYVIDCHAIPTSISDATVEGLKVGYRQFNDLQVAKATEDYVDVDCGSLNIGEYFANFLDFANVSCDLFLPFVGFVPIESEYWNGGTLHVVYRFNIVDGSFQAKVLATSSKSELTESIIGQYGGVACVHYPITGLQYSNVVAGLVNGSISAVAHGSAGDVGGVATNLVNMAMLRPDNPMSNGYNASSSFLTHRTPYLVIKRPKAQFSTQYNKEMGLPLNVALLLSTVHGFTVIDNPVININCNDTEYSELIRLLKNGVVLP